MGLPEFLDQLPGSLRNQALKALEEELSRANNQMRTAEAVPEIRRHQGRGRFIHSLISYMTKDRSTQSTRPSDGYN